MSFSEEISQYIRQKHYRQINSVLFWQDGRILLGYEFENWSESQKTMFLFKPNTITHISRPKWK